MTLGYRALFDPDGALAEAHKILRTGDYCQRMLALHELGSMRGQRDEVFPLLMKAVQRSVEEDEFEMTGYAIIALANLQETRALSGLLEQLEKTDRPIVYQRFLQYLCSIAEQCDSPTRDQALEFLNRYLRTENPSFRDIAENALDMLNLRA